jgi:hypothetical protein
MTVYFTNHDFNDISRLGSERKALRQCHFAQSVSLDVRGSPGSLNSIWFVTYIDLVSLSLTCNVPRV